MARAIDADRLADGLKLHRQPTDQKHEADRQWAVGYNAGLDRALHSIAYAPTLTPPNEPLTLDELREMNGKPVWIENLEEPEKSQWRLCHWDRRKYLVLQGISVGGYLVEEYGEAWIAYAYHPVHIDRKKWEPCECCREPIGAEPYAKEKYPGICDFEVILDGGDEIAVNAYNHYTPVTEEVCFSFSVSFCPKCGRPLTDQAWAELEKRLRG